MQWTGSTIIILYFFYSIQLSLFINHIFVCLIVESYSIVLTFLDVNHNNISCNSQSQLEKMTSMILIYGFFHFLAMSVTVGTY